MLNSGRWGVRPALAAGARAGDTSTKPGQECSGITKTY